MQKSNGTKADATTNTPNSAVEIPKGDYLIEYKDIPHTPFKMVKAKEQYFISLGNLRLIEPQETEEQALQELELNMWNVILLMTAFTIDKMKHDNQKHEIMTENKNSL